MKKTLLYRWFGIGAIPKKIRPALETEGIVAADEGMGGWFVAKNVKGPKKRYIRRREGFVGCLVITRKRIVCYTFGKRQMHISVDDPAIADLCADLPEKEILAVSFDAGRFRSGWQGILEFRFNTDQADRLYQALTAAGVRPGRADEEDEQA